MGSNDDVHISFFYPPHGFFLLFRAPESGDHINLDGEPLKAVPERVIVLLRKDGGRYKHRHLF